ncbi:hypothetical protein [uncultured Empedobacter sp.]|uniref:hypothetical protein n=1 Tax=uncultured Empedobacter sp. TaxID=410844 RepID=UPI0025FDE447|nr:hypothetical protein [uncultured Empedobacter sp.]
MANLLTITKEPNDYFTFVLNGDTANAIRNTRNDLLTVGNIAHFKTSQGANLIKEQNVPFGNVTIVDGATSLVPTSVDDLFTKLISVGFFDWINVSGGSGGVDRFDELLDTFNYFGKDGQVPVVDEAQLRLIAKVLPNTDYLNFFPSPLVPGKILRVKGDNSGFEFTEAFNVITQEIRENETSTAPSEAAVFAALQSISSSILQVPKISFTADGTSDTYDTESLAEIKAVFIDNSMILDELWEQTGTEFTLTFIPDENSIIKPI